MLKKLLSATIATSLCLSLFVGCGPKPVQGKTSSGTKSSSSSVSGVSGDSSLSGVSDVASGSSLVSGVSGSSVKPGTSSVKPGASSVKPGTSSAKPGTSTVKPGTSSVKPGTSTPSKTGPVELKVWGDQANQALMAAVADYTDAHANVTINVVTAADSTVDGLRSNIAAGTEPDILMLDHVYITACGTEGLFKNLVPLGANNIKSKFIPSTWAGVSFGNAVYGLPHDGNTICLMYNKTMLQDNAHQNPPTTLDQLKSVGTAVAAANPGKQAFTEPFVSSTDTNRLNWAAFNYCFWLWGCGGDILSPDNKTAIFNQAPGIQALQMIVDLKSQGVTDGATYQESQFYSGDVGMIEMGNWAIGQLQTNTKLGVTKLPILIPNGKSVSGLGLFAVGITSSTSFPADAFNFISAYTTNVDYQIQYCKQNNQLPVTYSALADPFYTQGANAANWAVFIDQYKTCKARPGVSCWTDIQTDLAQAIISAIGGTDPKAALDAAAAKVNILLKK